MVIQLRYGNLDSGWDGDGTEWIYSVYLKDKLMIGLGDQLNFTGKDVRRCLLLSGLCFWLGVGALHLDGKNKNIGPKFLGRREIIKILLGILYLPLPLKHLNGDVNQVGTCSFILPVIFECIYNPRR